VTSARQVTLFCEPKESNSGGGANSEADFLTELKSSDCEPKESNSGGRANSEADFLTELKSSDCD
jgi:hypothetical protein